MVYTFYGEAWLTSMVKGSCQDHEPGLQLGLSFWVKIFCSLCDTETLALWIDLASGSDVRGCNMVDQDYGESWLTSM